eukprot:TRINITY_DN9558_c0_g4_i2.p1 TRINITY_DN9558_c0_g4~~TRINITY_DN9558_c0_g4_i2.p1  ORF type:complete len:293 (+),score=43.83 TRINITY_DN9558_c0_g4_i2:227-1105(+)
MQMILRPQEVKIHPACSMSESPIVFERASAESKRAKLPSIRNVDADNNWLAIRFLDALFQVYNKIENSVRNRRGLGITFMAASVLFTGCHLGLEIYLTIELIHEGYFEILCAMLFGITILLVINCFILYQEVKKKKITECMACLHVIIILNYLGVGFTAMACMYKSHRTYFILVLLLTILSMGLAGIHSVAWILLFLVFLFFQFVELVVRALLCQLYSRRRENDYASYFPYYYDPAKTSNKTCSICLIDFVERDFICVFKCYSEHILHENCALEWLYVNPICPMCRAPAELA